MTQGTLTAGADLDDRFALTRRLHAGTTSAVWLVRDRRNAEDVAAKIVSASAPAERLALLRSEWNHLRRLDHPNIVKVLDFEEAERFTFMTMHHVAGGDIGRFRGRRPFEILRLTLPLADALQHAHSRGIVHRDVKVSNVLCDAASRPQLIDFGISGRHGTEEPGLTGGGSPYSASPQQQAGEPGRPADDIYAFGVLLYELVHGDPPFWPDVTPARVREEPPAPMRSPYPLDPGLADLIARLLAKSADDRPPDMAAVQAELARLIRNGADDETGVAPPAGASTVRLTPPPRVTAVRPLSHRPTSGQPARGADVDRVQRNLKWMTFVLIGALIAVAAAVFFVLPRWSQQIGRPPAVTHEAPPAASVPSRSATSVPEPEDPGDATHLKQRVAELRHRAAGLIEELTAKGAASWNADGFVAATAGVSSGEEHLRERRYAEAEDAFALALRQLESLDAESLTVLEQALSDGQRSLAAADHTRAAAAFSRALKIAPDNRAARSGRKRADVLPEVLALLDSGERSEREGRLDRARERYRQAVTLDPLWHPAQDALKRVRQGIAEDGFAHEMSAGLRALHAGEFAAARAAFASADALRPDSSQVADALEQVEEAQKLQSISVYREEALALEAAENWPSAAERYAAVLELDPTIRFAQEGQRRSLAWTDLSAQLAFHVDNPARLSSEAVFEEASSLLVEARKAPAAGPRHRDQVQRLETLLQTAVTPIRVYLESDNLTEITVYQVGRLGTFTRRALELRPGSYTVVGSRQGYRDVRRQLVVEPDATTEPFLVRCEEEI